MRRMGWADTPERRRELRKIQLSRLDSLAPHPSRTRRRAITFAVVAVIPAAVVLLTFLALLIWSFAEPAKGLELLLWTGSVFRLLVPLLVFMGGFGAAGLLVLLASKAGVRFAGGDAQEGGQGVLAALVATVIVGAIGVGLSIWSNDGRIEILGHVLLVMPFVISVSILAMAVDRAEGRSNLRVLGLIPLGIIALLYLSVVFGSGTRLLVEGMNRLFGDALLSSYPQLNDLDNLARSLAIVLLFAGIGVWVVLRRPWGGDGKDADGEDAAATPSTWLGRLWAWFCRLLARLFGSEDAEERSEAPATAEFLTEILDAEESPTWLAGAPIEVAPTTFFGRSGTAVPRVSETPFWRGLFGGEPPTIDQVAAMETLLGRREGQEVQEDRPGVMPDLLVEGEFSSGRTTFIAAAAIASTLLRGQGALIVVPDRAGEGRMTALVARLLEWARLDGLIAVSGLHGRDDLTARSGSADLPQILVGTVSDVQRLFFEDRLASTGVQEVLCAIGVILVDDLLDFSQKDRIELPFVLQKIRMVQTSHRTWMQMVVVVPAMSTIGPVRDHLAQRLFSQVHPHETVTLRNWRKLPDVVRLVPVARDSRSAALSALCEPTESDWGHVVVVSASEDAPLEIPTGLADRVHVVRREEDMDRLVGLEKRGWLTVIEDGARVSRQIAARIDLQELAERTIWISILEPGAAADPAGLQIVPLQVPVLGSAMAQGTWLRHAMEVIPHLAPLSPIDRNDWVQFGLPGTGQIQKLAAGDTIVPAFELELDPPDAIGHISSAAMSGRRTTFQWVAVKPGASRTGGMLDFDREYRVGLQDGRSVVVVGGDPPAPGRLGYWLTESGQSMGSANRLDFAVTDELEHRHGGTRFAAAAMRQDPSGRVRVTARAIDEHEPETAFRYPVWSGGWVLPPGDLGSQILIVSRTSSLASVRRLDFDDAGHVRRHVLRSVRWEATRLMNGRGATVSVDLEPFQYSAGLTVLLVGSALDQIKDEGTVLQSQVAGPWALTGGGGERQYWPELTAALNRGFRAVAPGVGDLGRILVFRRGRIAQIALIEPWGSLGSLPELVDLVLQTRALRRRLARKARETLEELTRAGDGPAFSAAMARRSGFCVEGCFEAPIDPAAAREVVQLLDG